MAADPSPTPNVSTGVSPVWQEYTAVAIQAAGGLTAANLTRVGHLPRRVVMKAAGDLVCTDSEGSTATLTSLPAWYVHEGAVQTIGAAQAVDIIVYW